MRKQDPHPALSGAVTTVSCLIQLWSSRLFLIVALTFRLPFFATLSSGPRKLLPNKMRKEGKDV